MKKYRKIPHEIEAIQFDGKNGEEIKEFTKGECIVFPNYIMIKTLEGDMGGNKGDWIIKGIAGEFYPCKDHIFKRTYEEVE